MDEDKNRTVKQGGKTMVAKYIYKKRTVSLGQFNRFVHRRQTKYGRWITVSKHDTLEEAQHAFRNDNIGLYDRTVFYQGKRIVDSSGKVKVNV